jgi:hypothetical protein
VHFSRWSSREPHAGSGPLGACRTMARWWPPPTHAMPLPATAARS